MQSQGKRIFLPLMILVALAGFLGNGRLMGQQNVPTELIVYPDIVAYNGKILTADDKFTIVEAIAVRDGKFLALGTTDRILKLAGPRTRKLDLQGKTITPGFIETHYHTWAGNVASNASRNTALIMPGYDAPMFIFYTKEKGLESLKKITDQAPPGKWLWTSSIRNTPSLTVTAKELDTASPNNPVAIVLSPQDAVVNSKALALMLEQVPALKTMGGLLQDQSREYTGQLRGNAFGTLMYDLFPWDTVLGPMIAKQKKDFQQDVALGRTTRIGRAQGLSVTILNELHTQGELPLRVRITHEFLRMLPDPERFFKRMGNLVGLGDDWFRIIGAVGQQTDGTSRGGSMLTSQPKLRSMPGDAYGPYGVNYWSEDMGYPPGRTPRETILMAGKYGWNITSLHSYGDKTAEMELDAFEEAQKQWPKELTKHRYVFDHDFIHTADTIAKAKKLGVLMSVLIWYRELESSEFTQGSGEGEEAAFGMKNSSDPMIFMYGVDRLSGWSRAKSLIASGIKPMAETTGTPLQNMQWLIDRKDAEGKVWGPQEAVDRKTALWMKTRWAAYYTEEESKLGSIETGKLADFVVLGKDYMTAPVEEIGNIPVLMTVVGGKVQYEASNQK